MPTGIGSNVKRLPEGSFLGGAQQAPQQVAQQREDGKATKVRSIGALEHESQQGQLNVKDLPDDLIGKIFDNIGLRHKVIGSYLLRLGGIALTDVTEGDRKIINKRFRWAAANGDLNVLQYLHETFGLTKEDAQADNNDAFRWAASNGHLEVLKLSLIHI